MAAARVVKRALSLDGVWIPLTTPFGKDGSINWKGLEHNLRIYERVPFAGYVVAGSNGEAPYISPEERIQLVKAVRKTTEKPIIGGATAESTTATCQLAKGIADAGADGLLVMAPFYFRKRMTDEALSYHFKKVAEETELPLVIYNMPFVTGIDISTPTLAKLAEHELIRGVKDSDIRKCAATVQETRSLNFDVLIGSAGYLLGALLAGCAGGINGLAGVMGADICKIYSCFKSNDIQKANEIQNKIVKADILFMVEQGVPGLKAGMDNVGLVGGDCRVPIQPLPEKEKEKIRQFIHDSGLLPVQKSQQMQN
ncbi:4-hydroxy-2-oxoglutarate aldolase, mitochondrial [Halyomorpha halys]|uniref:4-hydroxy-2-oxoglutarate aldolase, mitochondrial n=1 Tax=Halyomorpha halys TaxID=286706 RepID=UPI0006D4FFD4|nr:4-hydroxy-2-oxoglutarate aldolase, mitochondrial-like [Halyomorpha halys]